MRQRKVLITGASGFIGGFLTDEALKRGYEVWAGVRSQSSRTHLQDERIRFIQLNYKDEEALKKQLADFAEKEGAWDYVIHNAGLTKTLDKANFFEVNAENTRRFLHALAAQCQPGKFLLMSSLSSFGQGDEKNFTPIRLSDPQRPNTAYGESKLQAENYVRQQQVIPYVILRPTGVYGPRERDYFLMAKSVQQHVDFAAGFKRQDITFVFVKDLVRAIYLAIEKNVTGRAYFVSDGKVYSSHTFSDLIRKELGNPWMLRFVCPLFLLKAISFVAENVGRILRKTSTLNCDKYRIMKQRNWRCDISPLEKELGYVPEYPLERGVKEIIAWYKKEGWL